MLRRSRRPIIIQEDPQYTDECRTHPEDDDIPLPDLGKLVKGLWRSMSRTKKGKHNGSAPAVEDADPDAVNEIKVESGDHDEGGVWIESIGSWADPAFATQRLKLADGGKVSDEQTEATLPSKLENTPRAHTVP